MVAQFVRCSTVPGSSPGAGGTRRWPIERRAVALSPRGVEFDHTDVGRLCRPLPFLVSERSVQRRGEGAHRALRTPSPAENRAAVPAYPRYGKRVVSGRLTGEGAACFPAVGSVQIFPLPAAFTASVDVLGGGGAAAV